MQQSSKYLWLLKSTFWSDAVYFRSAFHTPYGFGKLVRSLDFLKSSQCRGRTSSSQAEQQFTKVRDRFPLFSSQPADKPQLLAPHDETSTPCLNQSACHSWSGASPLMLEQCRRRYNSIPLSGRQREGKSVLRLSLPWEYLKQNIPCIQKSC